MNTAPIFRWSVRLLAVVGMLALVGATVLAWRCFGHRETSDRHDKATRSDVEFVLNWAELPTTQNYKVLHSFESARSFTGDHVDGYCIALEDVPLQGDWLSSEDLEKSFREAVVMGLNFARQELSCLPSEGDLSARGILVKPQVLRFVDGTRPDAGQIIFLDKEKKELYFVGYAM